MYGWYVHRWPEPQYLVDERAHVLHLPHVLVCRARTRTDDVKNLLPEPRENVRVLRERKDCESERAGRRVAAGEEDVERLVTDELCVYSMSSACVQHRQALRLTVGQLNEVLK